MNLHELTPTRFYKGAQAAWAYAQGRKPDASANDTTFFYALPAELRQHDAAGDDSCCCAYCSKDSRKSDSRGPCWDTLAVSTDGTAWLVHYPRLNGRRRRRPRRERKAS